jgi:hypothetical protein
MSDDHPKPRADADAQLQREIRADRPFSLAEAIGRMAGPGLMKGACPIDRRQQACAAIKEYLDRHLPDAAGALRVVLLRHVQESELLLQFCDQPLAALGACVRQILASEYRLKELVREADVEWGRAFDERPCFDKDGSPPAPNDPYTAESVRAVLTQLAFGLAVSES